MIFQDRREAGGLLAAAVRHWVDPGWADPDGVDPGRPHPGDPEHSAIVLALPRGGVPVAFEVARGLQLRLDVFIVRKLGVPGQEELAMGAIASGGGVIIQDDVIRAYGIPQSTIDAVAARERMEIERREALYRAGRAPLQLEGRTAIVVDDGLATGSTMKAAIQALRPLARRVVVAVPVAARSSCDEVASKAHQFICLATPERFHAVGEFYRHFDQTSDEEVCEILRLAWGAKDGSDGSS